MGDLPELVDDASRIGVRISKVAGVASRYRLSTGSNAKASLPFSSAKLSASASISASHRPMRFSAARPGTSQAFRLSFHRARERLPKPGDGHPVMRQIRCGTHTVGRVGFVFLLPRPCDIAGAAIRLQIAVFILSATSQRSQRPDSPLGAAQNARRRTRSGSEGLALCHVDSDRFARFIGR
jgi:hypothetical protein